jgi:hypothetical protein
MLTCQDHYHCHHLLIHPQRNDVTISYRCHRHHSPVQRIEIPMDINHNILNSVNEQFSQPTGYFNTSVLTWCHRWCQPQQLVLRMHTKCYLGPTQHSRPKCLLQSSAMTLSSRMHIQTSALGRLQGPSGWSCEAWCDPLGLPAPEKVYAKEMNNMPQVHGCSRNVSMTPAPLMATPSGKLRLGERFHRKRSQLNLALAESILWRNMDFQIGVRWNGECQNSTWVKWQEDGTNSKVTGTVLRVTDKLKDLRWTQSLLEKIKNWRKPLHLLAASFECWSCQECAVGA